MAHHPQIATLACLAGLLCGAASASAQDYRPEKPRRQFVTLSYEWLDIRPLHFAEHPVKDLVGSDVDAAQFQDYDYRTPDNRTFVDVLEFSRRGHGAAVTVYPFGMSIGTTLALRGSIEAMPTIRIAIDGPAKVANYALTNGRAYDGAVALYVADRSPGWGIGAHTFVAGGAGRISSDLGDGGRYFAEAGGGVSSGPLGVELSVKFAWNRLSSPVDHSFMTVPITVRGTVSF